MVSQRVNELLTERAQSFGLLLDDISLVSPCLASGWWVGGSVCVCDFFCLQTHLSFGREFTLAVEMKQVGKYSLLWVLCVYIEEPPIKDTLKEDKPPNKGQTKSTDVVYNLCKITSERGQPLYKGQWAGSRLSVSSIQRFHCIHKLRVSTGEEGSDVLSPCTAQQDAERARFVVEKVSEPPPEIRGLVVKL